MYLLLQKDSVASFINSLSAFEDFYGEFPRSILGLYHFSCYVIKFLADFIYTCTHTVLSHVIQDPDMVLHSLLPEVNHITAFFRDIVLDFPAYICICYGI